MSEPAVVISDLVSTLGFATAAGLALFARLRVETPAVTRATRVLFASAMTLYALVGVSNVLEHAGITKATDVYEDYAEVLFVPLLAYTAYSMYMNLRVDERARGIRLAQRQNDMLMSIVDTVPSGIMLVDRGGGIGFANEPARLMLGLREVPETGRYVGDGTRVLDPTREDADIALSSLVQEEPLKDVLRKVVSPSGGVRTVSISSTPMHDATGTLGGSVVAFEDVTGRD